MSEERIVIRGPEHRVAILGALLAQKWLGQGRSLVLAPDASYDLPATILARPDHLRFHDDLGLSLEAVVNSAAGKAVLAPTYVSVDGPLMLPFVPIGQSQEGIDFHHFFVRADAIRRQPDLMSFSHAITLQDRADQLSWGQLGKGGMAFALELQTKLYVKCLLDLASKAGAVFAGSKDSSDDFDLEIDCAGTSVPGWRGGLLSLRAPGELPGMDWQICVNAARRFVGLSSNLSNSSNESGEYSRLAKAESERILDMEALLFEDDVRQSEQPALRRKVELFSACGRIPTEDFEVFTPPEWLAALWGRGLRPRRYDRRASIIPEKQLLDWIATLRNQIQRLNSSRETA